MEIQSWRISPYHLQICIWFNIFYILQAFPIIQWPRIHLFTVIISLSYIFKLNYTIAKIFVRFIEDNIACLGRSLLRNLFIWSCLRCLENFLKSLIGRFICVRLEKLFVFFISIERITWFFIDSNLMIHLRIVMVFYFLMVHFGKLIVLIRLMLLLFLFVITISSRIIYIIKIILMFMLFIFILLMVIMILFLLIINIFFISIFIICFHIIFLLMNMLEEIIFFFAVFLVWGMEIRFLMHLRVHLFH